MALIKCPECQKEISDKAEVTHGDGSVVLLIFSNNIITNPR